MRKPDFCLCENKGAVTAKLIIAFVFATRLEQVLFFLNAKFQASSHSSVAAQTGLCQSRSENPEDRFSHITALIVTVIRYESFSFCPKVFSSVSHQ